MNLADILHLYIPKREMIKRYINEGAYSAVYQLNYHRVIKINTGYDGSYEYVKWCMEKPAIWKPKIYSLYKSGNNYVAVMKRYYKIPPQYDFDNTVDKYIDILDKWRDQTKSDWKFDLHRANVMLDGNGKIILTDPICNDVEEDYISI